LATVSFGRKTLMGRGPRDKPERLGEKLRQIRKALGLSQNEMVRHLELDDQLSQEYISGFELGTREPSFGVVLRYARAASVWMDVLVDDELDLPTDLPATGANEGIPPQVRTSKRRPSQSRKVDE
jgi:transcriptional regulator with XRE-family HTH domain